MSSVILQPAGNGDSREHYADTIENFVDLSAYQIEIGSEYPHLAALYPDLKAPLWGATPGQNDVNVSKYNRARVGDFVLFFREGGAFVGGTITHLFTNAELAETLWGKDHKDQTWELMFALDDLRTFDLPYAELNQVCGYKPNNIVQGFTVLDEARSAALFDCLALDNDAHSSVPTDQEYKKAVAPSPLNTTETDQVVTAKRRIEQAYLRSQLGIEPEGTAECALCGETLPSAFLVAAHIKKRAVCTHEERLDVPAIGMAACKFGCDTLYEEGFITVGADGHIKVSPYAPAAGPAVAYLDKLNGRSCEVATEARMPYFAWHESNTFKK